MSFRTAPSLVVVKREEKEEKLKTFIADTLAQQMSASGASAADASAGWTVIARSIESPVVRALAAVAADSGPLATRLALAILGPDAPEQADVTARIAGTTRHLADPRHLNAHEQLILGPATSWVGDCMRREPAKRDAYEQYAPDCLLTAGWARTSFERLWHSAWLVESVEKVEVEPPAADALTAEAALASTLPGNGDLPPTTTVSTRH